MICSRIDDFVRGSWNVSTGQVGEETWDQEDSSCPFLYRCHSVRWYKRQYPWSALRKVWPVRWRVDRKTAGEGVLKSWCFPGPSECSRLNYEWSLKLNKDTRPYVIDCSSAASSPDEWDTGTGFQGVEVDFFPWILISSDDYTRVITVYKQ